jgi:hypothetical protein
MNKKFTIVKVLPYGEDFIPTTADLERWRNLFAENKITTEEAIATGEVEIETVSLPEDGENSLTLVKIGNENYIPTTEDLEKWRALFEEAQKDPNFKIFTAPDVDVSIINIGDIVDVE